MADGITIIERVGVGLASVMARKGVTAAEVGAALDLELKAAPVATASTALGAVGTGPGTWLVQAKDEAAGWVASLTDKLSGLASVSDQSGGYVIFRLSGSKARDLLQRGAFIDLDPAVFGPGSAATTVIAHMGVILWQVDETPTYDIALFRSFAHSFRDWIDANVATL